MDIGIFGGSFDPPHLGHAAVISWLLETRQVRTVVLVPAFKHAFGKHSAPFEERLRWCQALAGMYRPSNAVMVSPIEEELPAPSYMLHTLEALQARFPLYPLRLVVGSDILGETNRWYRWDDIVKRFNPLWVSRAGYPAIPGSPVFPDVSSTLLREMLARGDWEEARKFIPVPVLNVLSSQRLSA